VPDLLNPIAWNRYAYAYNSPLVYTDPSGHIGIPAIALIAALGFLGGEIYAGTQGYTPLDAEFWHYSLGGAGIATFGYLAVADLSLMMGFGLQGVGLWSGSTTLFGWGMRAGGVGAALYAWAFQPLDFSRWQPGQGALSNVPEGGIIVRFVKEAHYRRIVRSGMMKIKDFQTFATTPEHLLSLGTNDPAVIAKDLRIPLERAQYFVAIRREVLDQAGVVWSEQEWEIVWRFLESKLETINLSGYIVDMGKTAKLSEEFLRGLLGQ
jgi:hypothetical protein